MSAHWLHHQHPRKKATRWVAFHESNRSQALTLHPETCPVWKPDHYGVYQMGEVYARSC